jgi:hypothetical protein
LLITRRPVTCDDIFERAKSEVPMKGLGCALKFVRLEGRKAAYPPYAMPYLQAAGKHESQGHATASSN